MDDATLQITPAKTDCPLGARPYHHGDLRRALVEAAKAVLEREGPQALSLRAVAREAGVSPAAPYHHFKDKGDLLSALAEEGFAALGDALRATAGSAGLSDIGVGYVRFARSHPALYRVMYDCARNKDAMPGGAHEKKDGGYQLVKEALLRAGAKPETPLDLELACVAAWCAAHGVAEMTGFAQFKPMIEALGGEEEFVRAVLQHLGHTRRVEL